MKIELLKLIDYKYLQFSGISEISIKPEHDIQVIIGDNGSGKSRLMAMFAPIPPQSTVFGKNGGLELHIEHNNIPYIIKYDASTKKHSFQQNGIDLNEESGTSAVNEELVATHLGYTKLIDKLIFNKMRMTQMAAAARMEFLTSINPINVKFIKDKYVKIASQLKKIKAQIELLHKRISEYRAVELDTIEYEKYVSDKHQLQKFDNEVVQYIYKYDAMYNATTDSECIRPIDFYKSALKNLTHFKTSNLRAAAWMNPSHRSIAELQMHKENIVRMLDAAVIELSSISKEITELEQIIATSDASTVQQLEIQYKEYETTLKSFPDYSGKMIVAWPPKQLDDPAYTALHKVAELTSIVIGMFNSRIWNRKKYVFHNERFFRIIRERDEWNRQLSQCMTACSNACTAVDNATRIKPDSSCSSSTCPLKNRYVEVQQIEQNKLTQCQQQRISIEKQLTRCHRILNVYNNILEYQRGFHGNGVLNELQNQIRLIEPTLCSLFPDGVDTIAQMLNRNANSVFDVVKKTLKQSSDYWEMKNVEAKLKELDALIKSKKADISINFAMKKVKEDYIKLHTLEKSIDDHKAALQSVDTCIKFETRLQAAIDKTRLFVDNAQDDVVSLTNQAKRVAYLSTKKQLVELHEHISSFLRDMDTILSEQSKVKQLLEIELNAAMELTKLAEQLAVMEKALNPYSGLPSMYTKKHLEKLLTNVNYFISKVFTYKLNVALIEDTKDMKYKFNVTVDDVPAGDISCCSDGQMEIIDLAFTLAIMIALNLHKSHPLFLDEIGRCLDSSHTQRLLELLRELTEQRYIHQLFIINHQAVLAGGFDNADVICLRSENIITPETYNKHVSIL